MLTVVQLATLSAAYYVLEHARSTVLPVIILIIGAVITILVFLLIKRSEAYRDEIRQRWLSEQFTGFDVPLKWPAGLSGGDIACILLILSLIIDVVFVLEVRTGFLGLFPWMECNSVGVAAAGV